MPCVPPHTVLIDAQHSRGHQVIFVPGGLTQGTIERAGALEQDAQPRSSSATRRSRVNAMEQKFPRKDASTLPPTNFFFHSVQ